MIRHWFTRKNQPHRSVFEAVIWALFVLLLSSSTAAGEGSLEDFLQLSLEELSEVEVITPTRTNNQLAVAPGVISIITRDQISRSPARTLPALLRQVPGVNVRWNPMVQTIDIRSFGANPFTSKVLLLIDGVPYNSWNKGGFPQHPGFDFFNIDIVERIEIVRGSGSALYGENAFNGLINIVTLDGRQNEGTQLSAQAGDRNLQILSASHGKALGQDSSIMVAGRVMRAQLPVELWYENDLNADGYDLYVKGQHRGLTLTAYRRQDNFDGYDVTVGSPNLPADARFRSADEIRQSINIFSADHQFSTSDDRWSISSRASFANRNGSHCAGCHAPAQHPDFTKSTDHGYQALGAAEATYRGLQNHQLLFGTEWRALATGEHDEELHGATQTGGHAGSHEAVERYRKGAFYLQDEISLFNNDLRVTLGLRYDTRTSPRLFRDNWFPRLSLLHRTSEKLTLRAGWSKAARYPSFSELYQDSWFLAAESEQAGVIPLAIFEPNGTLKPELITSFEAGFEFRAHQNLSVRVDAFENQVQNPIIIPYPVFSWQNHPSDARVRGAELQFMTTPTRWLNADLSWSFQNNERRSQELHAGGGKLDFTYSPQHKASAVLRFTPSSSFSATLQANWRDEVLAPSFWYPIAFGDPERRPLPDYTYVDLRLDYRPQLNGGRPLTISLIGRNLLDETPYETLSGFGGRVAGRELRLELSYRRAD